jgi:hypothetical protein
MSIVLNDKAYLNQGGNICPACQSDQTESGPIETDGAVVTQEVTCNNCGASWKDFYKLTGYIDLVIN